MSKLYIIPTPIGNLEDITLRAIRLLKEADLVLAEDTRTSNKLFSYYNIDTPLLSFHMYNEHKVVSKYIERLKDRIVFYCFNEQEFNNTHSHIYLKVPSDLCFESVVDKMKELFLK